MNSNAPLSEQIYRAGLEYADALKIAHMAEEMKTAWIAQQASGYPDLSNAAAERAVKASPEYEQYIKDMVGARHVANRRKAHLEALRAKVSEQISMDANHRLQAKT